MDCRSNPTPGTPLDRRGPPRATKCTRNQPRTPIRTPFRGTQQIPPACPQVPSICDHTGEQDSNLERCATHLTGPLKGCNLRIQNSAPKFGHRKGGPNGPLPLLFVLLGGSRPPDPPGWGLPPPKPPAQWVLGGREPPHPGGPGKPEPLPREH